MWELVQVVVVVVVASLDLNKSKGRASFAVLGSGMVPILLSRAYMKSGGGNPL